MSFGSSASLFVVRSRCENTAYKGDTQRIRVFVEMDAASKQQARLLGSGGGGVNPLSYIVLVMLYDGYIDVLSAGLTKLPICIVLGRALKLLSSTLQKYLCLVYINDI